MSREKFMKKSSRVIYPDPEYVTLIPKVICNLRDRLGWSQRKLADHLGVSVTTVARWEGGSRRPDKSTLILMLLLASGPLQSQLEALVGRTREEILADVPEIVIASREPAGRVRGNALDGSETEAVELLRQYNDAVTGLTLIYETACAGHDAAKMALTDLADKLVTRGVNWRRLKYFKK